MFNAYNPANGELLSSYNTITDNRLRTLLTQADHRFKANIYQPLQVRIERVRNYAQNLRDQSELHARSMTSNMGKPIVQARAEVEKCAWLCDYYADIAEKELADINVETDAKKSFVSFRPLGVLIGIMPWNFPYWQALRFAIPAILSGNTVLLKHAPSVPECAIFLASLFDESGFEPGTYTNIFITHDQVKKILSDRRIKGLSMTGSTAAGKKVASLTGKLMKKSLFELGGSDPYVILRDADIQKAVKACVTSRLINNGQSCVAAKRFIISSKVYDAFAEAFITEMKKVTIEDPSNESCRLGPLARIDLRDKLHDQVERAVKAGANVITGGYIPDHGGYFYPATVLENVKKGSPAYKEELFGPVSPLIRAKSDDDALRIANDTDYGLGASVFTEDTEKGEWLAKNILEAGNCFVNNFVKSDPRLPFGGIKSSGYGRELSPFGLKEFCNIKTVFISN